MKLDELLYQLFQTDDYVLTDTGKGLTNKNYLLRIKEASYIVRIPWENSGHIVNRMHEKLVMDAIHPLELDVPVLYFDAASGIKITRFVEGLWDYEACPFPDKIERAAKLMRKLHQAELHIHQEFQPVERLLLYRSHIHSPLYDLRNFDSVISFVKQSKRNHVLCHNDWVSGNILLSHERDYLIDYEYGADNDPLFDVMSFLTENNITEPSLRQRFYAVYFQEQQAIEMKDLDIWEVFHNLLWCTWAMMMWEARKETIYKKIAAEKYEALRKNKLVL